MQVTETLNEGLKRQLDVVVPAGELDDRLNSYLAEANKNMRLPGFRPGKVPMAYMRKRFGRSAMAEILNEVVNETVRKTLEDRQEKPALQPDIDVAEETTGKVIDGGVDLSFSISYEVLPEFTLGDFSEIEVEKLVAEVPQNEIDHQVEHLAEEARPFNAKEEDAGAEDGDRLMISFEGKIDGEPFAGGAAEDAPIVIGEGRFIPGFEEGLVGAKAGESRSIDVTFPDDYNAAELAGKAATFDVTVKSIMTPGDIALDDNLAKNFGFEDLAGLKEAVRKEISQRYEAESRHKVKRQLLDRLDEMHQFVLPDKLVDSEFDAIWGQLNENMKRAGETFESEGSSEDEARDEYRKIAERRVRLGLVLSEIGERNDIEVSNDELQKALFERMRQYPGQEKQVADYYEKNPTALLSLRAPIYEDKVIDYLLELAKTTEKTVSKEELFADEDDDEADGGDNNES